jgi:alkylated DNA repair dioxygenase AlkB
MADVLWQPSLLDGVGAGDDAATPRIDRSFAGLVRQQLDDAAWIDHVSGWVEGQDALFAELLKTAKWATQTRRMYDNIVDQPRLTASWRRANKEPILPILGDIAGALSARYGREFTSGGLNLYRDGRDSVAWHCDRIPKEVVQPIVGIVSLGHPRTFRLRPKGGGRSLGIVVHGGDLIVTGGTAQRTWEHSVPKVASAGPRISVTFRHGIETPDSPPGEL